MGDNDYKVNRFQHRHEDNESESDSDSDDSGEILGKRSKKSSRLFVTFITPLTMMSFSTLLFNYFVRRFVRHRVEPMRNRGGGRARSS